ncbi:hypothetical protein ACFO1B_48485 [Dactylosporangium siamense]|uniref:Uncharacterized protein n=1 Tax=Dactylosporangium siamense TaxID=685454 RepID=A0A919UE61_9ACTN|nr:hypothetical protein [Dactylosporangium siamense]GIG52227.1 hypothetical protein Dsi01nite_102680 [Dactylosporangium siamense]
MVIMEVHNDSAGWLVLWLEPLGEDRWLKPDETFHVRSDYDGDDAPFTVDRFENDDRAAGIANIAVWVNEGDSQVTDSSGTRLECGHQRPEEVTRKWNALLQQMRGDMASNPIPEGGPRRSFYVDRGHSVTDRSPIRRP